MGNMEFSDASTTNPVVVRRAVLGDIVAIRGVAERTWHATYGGLIPKADIVAFLDRGYNCDMLKRMLEWLGDGMLVAVERGSVVGYAMVGGNREGATELFALYVSPERQGNGIGARLWDAAISQARVRGASEILLWVLSENAPARHFYERRGARPFAHRDFPLGAGVVEEVGYRSSVVELPQG
jgi:ribosomal protein S18 acetylase RimI-like enzyme